MEFENLTNENVLDTGVESDTEEHSSSLLEYVEAEDEVTEFISDEIAFLHVPYERKYEARALGAKWSPSRKQWYVVKDNLNAPALIEEFSEPLIRKEKKPVIERTYLLVPYDARDFAKSLGARFDGGSKKWYTLNNNKNYEQLIALYEYSLKKEQDLIKKRKEILNRKTQKILNKKQPTQPPVTI